MARCCWNCNLQFQISKFAIFHFPHISPLTPDPTPQGSPETNDNDLVYVIRASAINDKVCSNAFWPAVSPSWKKKTNQNYAANATGLGWRSHWGTDFK